MPTNIVLENKIKTYYDNKDADIIIENIKKIYILLDKIQTYFIKFYTYEKDYLYDTFNNNITLIYSLRVIKNFWFNKNIFKYKFHDLNIIKKKNDNLKHHITNEYFIKYITYFEIYLKLKNEIVFIINNGHINFDIYITHLKNISKKINDIIFEVTENNISTIK